jgi:transposase-like protein
MFASSMPWEELKEICALPPMSARRILSPEFKAKVVLVVISGREAIQEIVADHTIHPI